VTTDSTIMLRIWILTGPDKTTTFKQLTKAGLGAELTEQGVKDGVCQRSVLRRYLRKRRSKSSTRLGRRCVWFGRVDPLRILFSRRRRVPGHITSYRQPGQSLCSLSRATIDVQCKGFRFSSFLAASAMAAVSFLA
jgi:hypothetical protein